jgi:hypothetical protein
MGKLLRAVLIATVLATPTLAVQASCDFWECRVFVSTANCRIRYGPAAPDFTWAASCQSNCDCMPDTSGNGSLNCDCYCTYNYCYDV